MTSPRYALLFAEIVKHGAAPSGDVRLPPTRYRSQEIALLEEAIVRKKQRIQRTRRLAQIAALAAGIGVGVGAWRVASRKAPELALAVGNVDVITGPATAVAKSATSGAPQTAPLIIASANGKSTMAARGGSFAQVTAGSRLRAGSRLVVDPVAATTLSLSTGTRLDVHPGSEMTVVEEGRVQILSLDAGALHAEVAKLSGAERFVVRTRDAEVEVRGTSFLVSVVAPDSTCGDGTTTRVRVDEGVVVVRHGSQEHTLRPGDRWPEGCSTDENGSRRSARSAETRALRRSNSAETPSESRGNASNALPSPRPSSSDHAASSRLSEENDLFATAMMAKRSSKPWLAIDRLDGFLERYPTSTLAENATVERMRLLMQGNPVRGIAAAKQYLVSYPAGFAKQEAEAFIAGTNP